MSDSDSPQHPLEFSAQNLRGFQVRPASARETLALLAFFPDHSLGKENITCLGAFGQPGGIPLGAVIVRPSGPDNRIGNFLIFVRPEFRRRKIGSTLVRHLYSLALTNHAEKLILRRLIHQDDVGNAFYRFCGLAPERTFATYFVEVQRALNFCQPIVQRFQSELDADHIRIAMLNTLEHSDIADFFSAHGGSFRDQLMDDLRGGKYDLSVCSAALRGEKIVAGGLCRSRPDLTSFMLEIILTAPALRNGPVSLAILAESARLALERKLTHCVFEADERHDHFAVGFARRCGAKAQTRRFRYSITQAEMREMVHGKDTASLT